MNYFFVFQNKTFDEEHSGGFLWAPKCNAQGHTKSHWKMMIEVKKGDAIIHSVNKRIVAVSFATRDCYSYPRPAGNFDDWQRDGWRVDAKYHVFENKIITSDYMEELLRLQPEKYAPFNSLGRGNTGYLFAANREMFDFILEKTAEAQSSYDALSQVLELTDTGARQASTVSEAQNSQYITEFESDAELIESLSIEGLSGAPAEFSYRGMPKQKSDPVLRGELEVYPRSRQTALNALAHANYLCEVDTGHPTFLRKNSDKSYTEPHHLVPMACSGQFEVSLDVEENIVSLCSNCHNQLHYGQEADEILEKLYQERKNLLEKAGISIAFEELLEKYC